MPPNAMSVLAKHGLVREAMEVEPIPEIMPDDARNRLAEFRATILNPKGGRDSIRWRGEIQSLSRMLAILEREHGASGLYGVCRNFRLVGHEKSLADEAKTMLPVGADLEDEPDDPPPNVVEPPPGTKKISRLKKIVLVAIKTFLIAILSALGAKFGGWLGGVIAATIAGSFTVLLSNGPDIGTNGHPG